MEDCSNDNIKNVFIFNGKTGNIKPKDFYFYLTFLPDYIQRENLCIFTKYKDDATNLTDFYSKKYSDAIIYSVGGDGTLNEIINGIDKNSRLAIVPLGTGNDFYKVYKNIEGTKKIDIGTVNGRKFINIASVGIDALIAEYANEYKVDSKFKDYEYIMGIINSIIKNPHYLTDKGNISLLAVCNGKYYGNGIAINPNYNLNDGMLELYQASDLSRLKFIKLFLKIYNSTHYNSKEVLYDKINNYSINAKYPLIYNVDGEIFYDNTITFSCINDGITLTKEVPDYVSKYILKITKS